MKLDTLVLKAATLCAIMLPPLGACSVDDGRALDDEDRSEHQPSGTSLLTIGVRYTAAADERLADSGIPGLLAGEEVRDGLAADSRQSLKQISDFLHPGAEPDLPLDWFGRDASLQSLLGLVTKYSRDAAESTADAESIVGKARDLLASYQGGDAAELLTHAPQLHLVSGLELAFLAEGIVLEPEEQEARNMQRALCDTANERMLALGRLQPELDASIDASYEGIAVELDCTIADSEAPCPTEDTNEDLISVRIRACFVGPYGQECSSSARNEVWYWSHWKNKWKVSHSNSDSTPTNAQLKEELRETSKQRRREDGSALVLGDETHRAALQAELSRIDACQQVPGFTGPPEIVPDPDFCATFDGRAINLQTADGGFVHLEEEQDGVYHDTVLGEGEHSTFTVRCDTERRISLHQAKTSMMISARNVGNDEFGYGTIVGTKVQQDPGAWFTPLIQDGRRVLYTATGRYLSATADDDRLGQVERVDSPGTIWTVQLAQ